MKVNFREIIEYLYRIVFISFLVYFLLIIIDKIL